MLNSRKPNRSLLFLICFLTLPNLWGQEIFLKELEGISLSENTLINDMAVDLGGQIWLGTDEGLLSSDGKSLYRYPKARSVEDQGISALFINGDSILLGWSGGYLSVYSISKDEVLRDYKLGSSRLNNIILDKHDDIWIGSEDEGLYWISSGKVLQIDVNFGIADNTINAITYSADADIISVATDRGVSVCQISNEQIDIKNLSAPSALTDNMIISAAFDNENRLWMGSQLGIIYRMEGSEIEEMGYPDFMESIVSIVHGKDRSFLLTGGRLMAWEGNENEFEYRSDLLEQMTKCILYSDHQLLFLSKENKIYISDMRLRFYRSDSAFEGISALYSDEHELLSVNEKGIFRLDHSGKASKLPNSEHGFNFPIELFRSKDASLWLGSYDQGLIRISGDSRVKWDEKDGLINNNVMTINEWKGKMYFGTLGGLSRMSPDDPEAGFENFNASNGLEAAYIYQLLPREEDLLIACDGDGLWSYDGSSFQRLFEEDIETVYSLCSNGSKVFAATKKHGVVSISEHEIERNYRITFDDKDLLIEKLICAQGSMILFDWEKGFGILNSENGSYEIIDESNGLTDYKKEFLNVFSSNGKNKAWLASEDYLVEFDYKQNSEIDQSRSCIQNISLFSLPIDPLKTSFASNEVHFSFDLRSCFISDPSRIKKQYRLIGLDSNWVNTQNDEVIYPRLPDGEYRFEFRSTSTDDFSNSKIRSYAFSIQKAFYKSLWFYFLILLLASLTIYGLLLRRSKKIELKRRLEYEKVRSEFELLKSQVNPHFLFNSLNTAHALVDIDSRNAKEYIMNLSNYLRSILTNSKKHVITLEEELQLARTYLDIQTKRYGKNLKVSIDIDDHYLSSFIPPLSLQTLIENALKHNAISKLYPLRLSIYVENDYLIIKNSMKPMEEETQGTQIGLANLKSRYELLFHKEIIVENDGLFFSVELPIIMHYDEARID